MKHTRSKTLALLIFLAFSCIVHAQKSEYFYDMSWKPCAPDIARYYSVVTPSDSGFNKLTYYIQGKTLQLVGKYSDADCKVENGYFRTYHPNGVLSTQAHYTNGKADGLFLGFHDNGSMADSGYYENGMIRGTRLSWHPNGYPSDSIDLALDGSGVEVSWFEDGMPALGGRFAKGYKKQGRWTYYHMNGAISSLEMFENDKLVDKQYFDPNGKALADTTDNSRGAQFPGGVSAWQNYLAKHLTFPSGYSFQSDARATVVIRFAVDEKGKISDATVVTGFHPAFDKIAKDMITRSPNWNPAVSHNRKLKSYVLQPITFVQNSE